MTPREKGAAGTTADVVATIISANNSILMLVRQFALLALAAVSCSAFMSQTPRISSSKLYSSVLTKDDEAYEKSLAADIEREVRKDSCVAWECKSQVERVAIHAVWFECIMMHELCLNDGKNIDDDGSARHILLLLMCPRTRKRH